MTQPSYAQLIAQREALEAQIAEARKAEISDALKMIHDLIADYGLTQEDVFPMRKGANSGSKPVNKVAPKYRDPATGKTWTGRGKPPVWIAGAEDRNQFLIAA